MIGPRTTKLRRVEVCLAPQEWLVAYHMQHSRATVLQATSHSYGARQNSTLRNFVVLGPIITKFGTIDYVGTPTHMPILVEFGWVGNSRQQVKYNLSVTFCSVPIFSWDRLAQKPVNGFFHDLWLKTREFSQGCAFWGFRPKNFYHPLTDPKIQKFCITKAVFRLKTHKSRRKCHQNSQSNTKRPMWISNLGLKIRPEIEIERAQNYARFSACAVENRLKIPENVVQLVKFRILQQIRHAELNSGFKL